MVTESCDYTDNIHWTNNFGVGVAILTVLMITYMQFFGASFVALVIMNLTTPFLDKVGVLKPMASEKKEPKLPKGELFTKVKTTACIRCGRAFKLYNKLKSFRY